MRSFLTPYLQIETMKHGSLEERTGIAVERITALLCIEVGKLPYSIGLNYLRNLQELSVEAVDYLSGLKECSREESFNIIQEWAKEFTEKYENYDFNGSYYDVIDAFIDEKLKTI